MATGSNGTTSTSATRVLVRVMLYYAVIAAVGTFAWRDLPRTRLIAGDSLDALFGGGAELVRSGNAAALRSTDQGTLALTVVLAMFAAAALALPVAWIYTLTRARRGYQQSLVQLLIVLPTVIAGVMVLVKYSIALAFGLGGVVAAVRFRNTLDDSKDAVYVFLVTGLGIAAAVDLPVAMVISVMFNLLVVLLWATDFGRTPVALDGKLAGRRLERARELARTGTFVARIDDEVLRDMTAEQLEGVAQRAWRRAREHDPDGRAPKRDRDAPAEVSVRARTLDPARTQPLLEARLDDATKRWTLGAVTRQPDGTTLLEYKVMPKKRTPPDELLALLRAAGGAELVDAEVRT
jgi:hypothetical protein